MSKFDNLYVNPKSFIVKLTIPVIIVLLTEVLVNIADSSCATFFGSDAVVALGLDFTIYSILIHIGRGVGTGANALISNAIGEDNIDSANNIFYHALILSLAFSIILTVGLSITLSSICQFISNDYYQLMIKYLYLIISSITIIFTGHLFQEVLRAQGDTKRPSIISIISLIIKASLNICFIFFLNFNIEGLAIATVISDLFITICLAFIIQRRDLSLTYSYSSYKRNIEIYKDLLNIAFPQYIDTFLCDGVELIIIIFLTQQAGGIVAAAYAIAYKIQNLVILPQYSLGMTMVSIIGFLKGKKDYDFIKRIAYKSIIYVSIITIIISILLIIFQNQVINIFVSKSDITLVNTLKWMLILTYLICLSRVTEYIVSKVFLGFGKSIYSLYLTILLKTIYFVDIGIIFILHLDAVSLMISFLISRILIIFVYLYVLNWYINKLKSNNENNPIQE